jgi:uncharacterized membrane protein YoaK (UPF0700 family)
MIPWTRGWVDAQRTPQTNARLGITLAFVAGAANAGGFLAVGQYTSHMTGVLSSVADSLVLGQVGLALGGLAMLLSFLLGAMTTAIVVNWGIRHHWHGAYGLPLLLLEAILLLVFGLFGGAIALASYWFVPLTVVLLCFIMGLQNAVISKISHSEIRTPHVTGLVTDMGIELGKMLYVNRLPHSEPVHANKDKFRLQSQLVGSFLLGAFAGALGFKHIGFVSSVPLAITLLVLVGRPLLQDVVRLHTDAR